MTKEIVSGLLTSIENSYQISTVFSSLHGSRMWGYNHLLSDWDVFIIYKYPIEKYLGIDYLVSSEYLGFEYNIPDGINGIELRSFLRGISKSNILFLSVLNSPVVYRDNPYFHYIRDNITEFYCRHAVCVDEIYRFDETYIKLKDDEQSSKNLIHLLLSVFIYKWSQNNIEFVPIDIDTMWNQFRVYEEEQKIEGEYDLLLSNRKNNVVLPLGSYPQITRYLYNFRKKININSTKVLENKRSNIDVLNEIFISIINE